MSQFQNQVRFCCYLGCAEPSWAEAVPEIQLSGLLNLSCLLSDKVYVTDVHLGDNVNFYHSYLRGDPDGLYSRLRSFADIDCVRFLLRDASYRPRAVQKEITCDSFSDVYRAWITHDPMEAWIYPGVSDDRKQYFRDLDSWALGKLTEKYEYRSIKLSFMQNIRDACFSARMPWFRKALEEIPEYVRSGYLQIVNRDWFSLSDIYSFLHLCGITGSHKFLLYNGLVNEKTYSDSRKASLIGADRDRTQLESMFWPEGVNSEPFVSSKSRSSGAVVGEILEHASEVLDAPSLSVISRLSAKDISELRHNNYAHAYFELLALSQDPLYVGTTHRFGERLVRTAADYWNSICEYYLRHFPSAAEEPTRLAILLGKLPEPITRASKSFFSLAVNVGPTIASEVVPMSKPVTGVVEKGFRNLSLRFLFITETKELKKLRSVIPDRLWFARPNPQTTGSDKRDG